jgi:hypothetical protein
MASSALCHDFTQHVCDAHSKDACARFKQDLDLLEYTVHELVHWRALRNLPPLSDIYPRMDAIRPTGT